MGVPIGMGRSPTYYSDKLSRKLYENKENWTGSEGRGRGHVPVPSLNQPAIPFEISLSLMFIPFF